MHGRYVAPLILASLALPGCVQATRHSNTMIFGTNTHFGIRAGSSAASVPEVNIGYARQEAVIMPLVANSQDDGRVQKPCDPSQAVQVNGGDGFAVHPCLLVGVNDKAQDSYSVLASFGSKFGGGADATGAKADGSIAQYFATGVAAQLLAIQGGASVVATGAAAKEAAKTNDETGATIAALYGGDATFNRMVGVRKDYDAFEDRLAAKIQLTKPEDLAARIGAFETATGTTGFLAADCTSPQACAAALRANAPYGPFYAANEATFEQALAAWKTDQ